MNNIPQVKMGILAVSRDCFPITLSEKRRKAIVAKLKEKNFDIYECQTIIEGGIVWGRGGGDKGKDDGKGKVRTKAKKKAYITGAHGSGSARQKAKYRQQRNNRNKGK